MCETYAQAFTKRKIEKLREKHRRICREVAEDIVNLALKIVAYRRANDGQVPTGDLARVADAVPQVSADFRRRDRVRDSGRRGGSGQERDIGGGDSDKAGAGGGVAGRVVSRIITRGIHLGMNSYHCLAEGL